MNLNQLFNSAPDILIDSLSVDSRVKSENSLFFCLKGMVFDGHQFVDQAISNGAVAIVHSDPLHKSSDKVAYILVDDVLKTLNVIASRFFGNPSVSMKVFGVTGTNGKSTTAKLLQYFINDTLPCGYIGTISTEYGNVKEQPFLTTPDVIPMHQTLKKMTDAGMKAVALEVSSHGLEQGRVLSVDFDVAIFTNLTHDHLDFHGNMENYFQAKKKLFTILKKTGLAVVNQDDPYGKRIISTFEGNLVTYGLDHEADFFADHIELYPNKTVFDLFIRKEKKTIKIHTNLVAVFNIYNLLGVIAALVSYGMDLSRIVELCKAIPQVDGRMEVINEGQNFNVIIDYAHTPDGFDKIFTYAKSITPPKKKIIVVFGSAGQRDSKKRRVLGELADRYCDMIVLTEEDNRSEKVLDICNEISKGILRNNYIIIEDRYDAIRQALEIACKNDTVLILGKGDESYMYREFGTEEWLGDHLAAKEILQTIILNKEVCTSE
jgi:UDP-N-acetylmuramoyl-L-alanyl-D-glutamate--2,6-diaminopimelate ligase